MTHGLFECEIHLASEHRPTPSAQALGRAVRDVLISHSYTLSTCQEFLQVPPVRRIYSANAFFSHRLEVFRATPMLTTPLQVLTWMFLFGLSVQEQVVLEILGMDVIELFKEAGIVTVLTLDEKTMIVGEVMIYPLSPEDLFGTSKLGKSCQLFFATDWPLESMRLPRDAIMPVGYDSLELLALSADPKCRMGEKVLDLCCGCGIQGIFARSCHVPSDGHLHLVSTDINKRAIHFVTANLAMNRKVLGRGDAVVMCGSLFESLDTARFDRILCNPPFVAVPDFPRAPSLQPALYAIGGGDDGMLILRQILDQFCDYSSTKRNGILMVTELPNVESSCKLLRSMLRESIRGDTLIRVAYVENDVETIEEYTQERQTEDGFDRPDRDWASHLCYHNRALVLVSIVIGTHHSAAKDRLYSYTGELEDKNGESTHSDIDEEDAFLTESGIAFAREAVLSGLT